jgi:UDP-glucose 4-epimerase
VIVRPFNISGPRQSGAGGFVLPRFIGHALMARPLPIFGSGSQVRAFTHVRDVCDGLVLAMRRGTSGSIHNTGNPANRMSITELADLVLKVTGSPAGTQFVDPRVLDGPLFR